MITGQIRRTEGLKKRRRHVIAFLCTTLHYPFLTIFYTKIGTIDLGTRFGYVKKKFVKWITMGVTKSRLRKSNQPTSLN